MNRSSNYSNNYNSGNAGNGTCNGTKYVIKKGDTLYSISRRYDVPLALVLRANPYVDVYNLQVGDEICIPSAGESMPPVVEPGPVRPPVIEGPGPVRPPVVEGPGPVRPPVVEEPGPVRPPMPMEPGPVMPRDEERFADREEAPAPSRRTEIGTGNTFNFNYYGGKPAGRDRTRREMPKPEAVQKPQAPSMAPARKSTKVRQTMPVIEKKPMPAREISPERPVMPARQMPQMREAAPVRPAMPEQQERVIPRHYMAPMEERPIMKTRMVAPVRIITKPMMEETPCMESEKDKCGRWCSYQDRERFQSIMNYDDTMNTGCCKKMPKCTQSVTKPESMSCNKCQKSCDDDDDNMTIISYVSRDNDTLQDILDYFTMNVSDLFQYNVPNTIRLKPGCMIHVPGKGDDK